MDEKRAERIENKLDKVAEDIGEIKVTQASQHVSLKEHMRRTELLEQVVEPMKKHLLILAAIGRIIGGVVTLAIFLSAVFEIVEYYVKK